MRFKCFKNTRPWSATICLIAIFLLAAMAGCGPAEITSHEILRFKIGQHDLFISKAYLRYPPTSVGKESGLIHAFYPGGAPLPDDPRTLFRQGVWYKHVSILFNDIALYPSFDINRLAELNVSHLHAHIDKGEQYGLINQTQASGTKRDYKDIWLEKVDGVYRSYITCTKDILPNDIPQCTHEFRDEHFSYAVDYDKRLLPHWRTIQSNVLALMRSFRSEEEAQAFLKMQMTTQNSKHKGN